MQNQSSNPGASSTNHHTFSGFKLWKHVISDPWMADSNQSHCAGRQSFQGRGNSCLLLSSSSWGWYIQSDYGHVSQTSPLWLISCLGTSSLSGLTRTTITDQVSTHHLIQTTLHFSIMCFQNLILLFNCKAIFTFSRAYQNPTPTSQDYIFYKELCSITAKTYTVKLYMCRHFTCYP